MLDHIQEKSNLDYRVFRELDSLAIVAKLDGFTVTERYNTVEFDGKYYFKIVIVDDVLTIYNNTPQKISVDNSFEMMSLLKNMQGSCRYES